ncbi:FecR family protein [Polaromonas sp. YR568]|uniref:FecR family protein n=1 Tax=Polaromonas sp. YR568 TaxID=1855301 RepID=UPI0008ECA809|nr:FecR domain-containing protein [Polaromonas sp. YR568]SFV00864.1 FecR family protein [Polaromonas sp. YR568]
MQADVAGLVEHALTLIASADVGTEQAAQRALQKLARWRAESARHEAAYQEADRRWRLLGNMAPALREQFSEPQSQPTAKPASRQRRALLSLGIAAAGAGVLGWRFYLDDSQPRFARHYRTGTGQLLDVTVPDGSRIDLSAQTELSVALYRSRRTVRLLRGEARFDVAHDVDKPFVVTTPSGTVEVLGTAFSVAERSGLMSVSVERGHVRVRPVSAGEPLPAVDLRAGEALTLRDGTAGPVRQIDVLDVAAWRSGWLVFDNTRLDEALPAINAFLSKPMALDASAAALRLTGRFRANDPASFLAALPSVLPVAVTAQADGGMRISAR